MPTSLPTPPAGFKYQAMYVPSSTDWDTDTVQSITGATITAGKTLSQFLADYYNDTSIKARKYTCDNGEESLCVLVADGTPDDSPATFNNPGTGNYTVDQEQCIDEGGVLQPVRCGKGGS